jgi:tRNA G37 N-methylase Trm5
MLLSGGAAHVHAADWNPDAIATLRLNLAAAGLGSDRATVWPGDNAALLGSAAEGRCDRVMLGLIPTSRRGWPIAVRLLKPVAGGTLHVHENVPEEAIEARGAEIADELAALARAADAADAANAAAASARGAPPPASPRRGAWECRVAFVSRVKSYAPRILHVV